MVRKQDALPDFAPAIERLRELVTESGDHLLLGDGPPHPDAALLELCAEAAEARKAFDRAEKEAHAQLFPNDQFLPPLQRTPEQALLIGAAEAAETRATGRLTRALRGATKIRATTAAGIYAKAIAVRASHIGAACLAQSLADDLLANKALRAALWSHDAEPAPNVAPLHGRRA